MRNSYPLYKICWSIFSLLLILLASKGFSQPQPGIGGVLTSDEKVIWLRAQDLSLSNNDPVSLWQDRSGNNNDALQSVGLSQPVYIADGGALLFNNHPVVRFNGNSHFMEIANSAELNNMEGLTIIFVMKPNAGGVQAYLTKRVGWGNQNRYGFLSVNNTLRLDVENNSRSATVNTNTSNSYLLTGMFNGQLAGNRQFVYINGIERGSRDLSITSIGANSEPVRLGRFNDGDNRNLNGDVAEILMYRTGLNNAQRLIVENALAIRYGINIGSLAMYTHPTFTHDIIGVGTTDGLQKHTETSGGGGGLYLSEWEDGFNEINEFVFAGHSGLEHDIVTSGLDGLVDVADRWERVWRIERRVNGIEDGGTTPVKITFDFNEAVLTPNYDNVYVLLFKLNESDTHFTMVPSVYASVAGGRATFNVPDALFKTGYYTIGRFTGDASDFMIKTWTSHGTGNWNDPLIWRDQYTNTGSPSASLTSEYDNIVIRNGHTITISENDYINNDLFIEKGGILNIANTRGHQWSTIRGEGRIRIIGDYFPGGNATQFHSVSGGTTEYNGSGEFTFGENRTFNNLTINLQDLASSLTLMADLTINGNFHINSGTFYINDNASATTRRITVGGDVRVAETTTSGQHVRLYTGTGNAQHFFTIRGNLTVNAETRFANLTGPSYGTLPDNGYVQTIFNHPTQNQTAQINARTEFYRIEINKGVDKTYSLLLRASEPNLFHLWGRTNQNQTGTPPNRTNNNSLGLLAGTVIIGDHIEILQLRNGSGENYDIDQDAQIIVDGGRLIAPANFTLAIVVYGKLTLERGYLQAMGTEGVTIREFGTFEVNDGNAQLHIVRTSVIAGIHRGAYVQTGGTVNILGTQGEGTHFRFSLPFSTNSFTMTGGTMNIRRPKNGGTADQGGILIGADRDNILVTGGTVNAYIDFNKNFIINSSAPFYNLNLIKDVSNTNEFYLREYGGGGTVPAQPKRPLEVINSLEIRSAPYAARLNLNGEKAIIHGDLVIHDGAQFVGTNSHLSFVGNRDSEFNIRSAIAVFSVDTLSLVKELPSQTLVLRSDSRPPATDFLHVNNFLKVERGFLNYGFLPLRLLGDLENHDAIGNEIESGRLIMGGSTLQNIYSPINNTTAYIGSMEINNTSGVRLHNNAIPEVHNLILTQGVFDIRSYSLTVTGDITGTFNSGSLVAMTGNHTDGGLIRLIDDNGIVMFPIGPFIGPNPHYSPLTAEYEYDDVIEPVFVQVNVVPQELPTLANDDPNMALRMYWRIRHNDATQLPNVVSYVFQHPGMEPDPLPAEFVPGKVVNLLRSRENQSNYNILNRTVTFNSGFSLEQGEYTAAHIDKFIGTVRVFYSIENGLWNDPDNWSIDGHNGAPGTLIPGPGDLAQIGFSDPGSADSYHTIEIEENLQVGGIHFLSDPSVNLPRLRLSGPISVLPGNLSGEGSLAIQLGANPPTLLADLGDFNQGERSEFVYQAESGSTFQIPANITVYPNLFLEGPTSELAILDLPNADLLIRGNLVIQNNARAQLSTLANGDLTILGDLQTGGVSPSSHGELMFRATGDVRNVTVEKDIKIEGNVNSGIFAENAPSTFVHQLIAKKDIRQHAGSISLFPNDNHTKVILSLEGMQNGEYTRSGGNAPSFHQIVMNKGINQNFSFAFNNSFTLNPDAAGVFKPIVLQHGILDLKDADIQVNLNTGGTNEFIIPSTAGLILTDATALVNGAKGILLNGLLKLQGEGKLQMTGTNAFIEYGNSGHSILEVHDYAELTVGSQIRRIINYDPAFLYYRQTGGTVTVGTISAPNGTRGVFEVTGNSSFRFTGGELIIARGHSGASFVLDPADFLLGEDAVIQFGHPTYSPNNNILRIKSARPLPNVVISGGTSFTARLDSEPLTILGEFHILGGNTFDTNNLDLFLEGDFINEGNFLPTSSTVTFNGVSQVLTGNTTFNKLVVDVASDLNLGEGGTKSDTNLLVNGDLEILSGTFIDNGYTINLKRNLVNHASHFSDEATGGIKFSGSELQNISGNGSVGRLELDNHNGVRLNNALSIQNELVFTNGILDIQGQRLTLGAGSSITSPNGFSPDKMIKTTGNLAAAGVRIFLMSNTFGEFLVPLGVTGKYTPVLIKVIQNPATPYLDIVPLNYRHIAIDDPNNLNFNWLVESNGLSIFRGELRFHYIEGDVVGIEEEYYPAWLSGEYWAPLIVEKVLENENYFIYDFPDPINDITGDYTAGSAIPDRVLRFRSTGVSTDWTNPDAWVNIPGNEEPVEAVPSGGPRGNIIEIIDGHTIIVPSDERIAYRSFIDGTLDLGATRAHYLGAVDGTGTLKLETASVPVGRYDNFAASGKGTFEFTGSNSFIVDPSYLPQDGHINQLVFSGTGEYTWPAVDLLLFNNLEIRDQATFNNELNNETITLRGDLIKDEQASFRHGFGSDNRLIFAGTGEQRIIGDFSGANRVKILKVDNNQGLTIEGMTEVETALELAAGRIRTTDEYVLRLLNNAVISGSSFTRYIEGPLQKEGVGPFTFPVGTADRMARIAFQPLGSMLPGTILEARYFPVAPPNFEDVEEPLTRVSSLEYWQLESVGLNGNPDGRVRLYYEDITFSHITDPASLLVGRYITSNDTGFWITQGRHNDEVPGYVESDYIDGMGFFTFASDDSNFSNNPLPVDLLSFTATVKGSEVLLEWVTASETNNNYFTVERSRDGFNFEVIGYVQGAGTTSQKRYYQLYDEQPLTGVSYYRLKQTDFDGTSEYFPMVAVQIRKAAESLMLVYPNPVRHGLLNVQVTNLNPWERTSVSIVDMHGRILINQPVYADDKGVIMHQFNNLSGLQAGIYIVIVQSRTVRIAERIILR